MVANEDVPVGRRLLLGSFSHAAIGIDIALESTFAIDVGPGIDGVGQHLMNFCVERSSG
jgi:hypothetical protein